MRIFADPTELASTSRLPKNVAEVCEPLPHLEELTGADLLVSPLPIPATSEALLHRHCESGVLIQLKRWSDLMSAIVTEQRLFYEVKKMHEWCPRSWLVISGVLFSINDQAVVGKVLHKELKAGNATAMLSGRPGLTYASVDGALDAWQYYGGYYKFLPDANDLLSWIRRHERIITAINAGEVTELSPRSTQRELRDPTPIGWLAALFDGIGRKTAKIVFDRVSELSGRSWPTLLDAISYATNYQAAEIPGITTKRIAEWRQHLGLNSYAATEVSPESYETIGTHRRVEDSGEIYWRNSSDRWHYRYEGRIDTDKVFTLSTFGTLLAQQLSVGRLLTGTWEEEVFVGKALRCELGPQFEWLILDCKGYEERLRIDQIVSVELLEG